MEDACTFRQSLSVQHTIEDQNTPIFTRRLLRRNVLAIAHTRAASSPASSSLSFFVLLLLSVSVVSALLTAAYGW